MAEALVVFGSKNDEPVYSRVMSELKANGIRAQLRICSAHRTPAMLEKIVAESDAKIIVAGAGLSAALPGVIASKTTKPVIGVPVNSAFAGLDSLLSTVQMPYGFPVIATGVNRAEEAAAAVQLALGEHSIVKVTGNSYNDEIKRQVEKIKPIANQLGLNFEFIESIDESTFNQKEEILVNVVELAGYSSPGLKQAIVLNVPMLKESSTPEALELFEKSRQGLWIGLNRVDNALLAAAQLLDIHSGKFREKILAIRKELADKVAEADKEAAKKGG
ncbi:MAG: 5-(carboxyamino)imidazole ribonucleotide mutase [Candidatus Diapherotrites archaeon]|nr:5-(carboxyamino)imidazole ribonucleotide mutase [Candidatus Diapherotrites archaeon]